MKFSILILFAALAFSSCSKGKSSKHSNSTNPGNSNGPIFPTKPGEPDLPIGQNGLFLHANNGTNSRKDYALEMGDKITLPTRSELGFTNGDKVFAGWCREVDPCRNLDDLAYYTGEEFQVQGQDELYALWMSPSENWEDIESGDLIIPNGVTSIPGKAFYRRDISRVVFPDTVIEIGQEAFVGNSISGTLVFPESLTSIGYYAFYYNQLTRVVLPYSLVSIGAHAFSLNHLTSIEFSESLVSIGEYAFSLNELTSIELPHSLESLGSFAFAYNFSLERAILPMSLEELDYHLFDGCDELKELTLGAKKDYDLVWDYPKGFAAFYNDNGKQAGHYIRKADGEWENISLTPSL